MTTHLELPMVRLITSLWLAVGVGAAYAQPAKDDAERQKELAKKPQYERMLKGEDAKKAEELRTKSDEAAAKDDYSTAIARSKELVSLRSSVQGRDHWQVTDLKFTLLALEKVSSFASEK